MKKIFKAFAVIASLVAVFAGLSACTSDGVPPELDTVPKVIKYVSAQGTKPADKSVQSGYTLTADDLPDLSADGFTWGGWHVGSETGSLAEVGYKVTKNLTLVAKWTQQADTYTITYKFGDEVLTGLTPATYKSSDGTITLPTPTKEHYTFGGWYESATDQSGTAVTSFESSDKANKTFYAKFTEITHTVTLNIGTDASGISFAENAETTKVVGEVTGWTLPSFTGLGLIDEGGNSIWTDHVPFAWATSSAAVYDSDKHFDDVNGEEGVSKFDQGAKITPTNELNLFVIWKQGQAATYDVTYLFEKVDSTNDTEENNYEEKTDENGGKTKTTGNAATVGETIEIPADTSITGFKSDEVTQTISLKTGIVIKVLYKRNVYTVTFGTDDDSISAPAPQSVKYGAKATEPTPAPKKEGYTFDGWFAESGENAFDFENTLIEKDITLTAKFTIKKYTVTFNSKGGSNVDSMQNVEHGNKITAPTAPTKYGYVFAGWYREEALSNKWNFESDTVTDNITLYAKWNAITYLVNYNANSGTGSTSATSWTYGETDVNLATNGFSQVGKNFSGWATSMNGTAISATTVQDLVNDSGVTWTDKEGSENTKETTLYAVWSNASYTVSIGTFTGGSVTAKVNNYDLTDNKAEYNATVTLIVSANDNYLYKANSLSVKKTGEDSPSVTVSGSGTTYTFTMPDNDVTVSAEFEAKTNAVEPTITTDLSTTKVNYVVHASSVTALNATATVSDGGTVTYQWYSHSSSSGEGSAISGATSATYTPPVTEAGTTYYYCVVTNTNGSATGEKTATKTSAYACIYVEAQATEPTITVNLNTVKVSYEKDVGNVTALSVTVESAESGFSLSYQWYSSNTNSAESGALIDDATEPSYTPSVTTAGTTYYYCVVTKKSNTIDTNTATVKSAVAEIAVTEGDSGGE